MTGVRVVALQAPSGRLGGTSPQPSTTAEVTSVALQAPSGRHCEGMYADADGSRTSYVASRCRRPAAGFAGREILRVAVKGLIVALQALRVGAQPLLLPVPRNGVALLAPSGRRRGVIATERCPAAGFAGWTAPISAACFAGSSKSSPPTYITSRHPLNI